MPAHRWTHNHGDLLAISYIRNERSFDMPSRSNALSELARFWLEARHGCLLRESVPVPVPYALSDIDFVAIRPDLSHFTLPSATSVGPRVIVESKDEHDWDASGKDFGKRLLHDMGHFSDAGYIPSDAGARNISFTMLRQQHFEVAKSTFGTDDFDRLFVVHALDSDIHATLLPTFQCHRISWITLPELLDDLRQWYAKHDRPAGLRNTLTGDLFHLLFGYCKLSPQSDPTNKKRNTP